METIALNKLSFNEAFSYLKNFFIPSPTDKMIAKIALGVFAIYLVYCTYRYFYYNTSAPVNGNGTRIGFFGTVYEGHFENGQLNGQGKVMSKIMGGLAETIGEGTFKDGKLEGQGKLTIDIFSLDMVYLVSVGKENLRKVNL